MVLVNQYIVQVRLSEHAPANAWQQIQQVLDVLPGCWQLDGEQILAVPGTSSIDTCMLAMSLAEKLDWFARCVTQMDLLRVVEVDDLKRLFNQMRS